MDVRSADQHVAECDESGDDGPLMIRRCTGCAALLAPLTASCASCPTTALEWVASSGAGSVVSWRAVQGPLDVGCGSWELSTIAVVQLVEGPLVVATICGEMPPPSGRSVRVKFAPRSMMDRFPVFAVDSAEEERPGIGGLRQRASRPAGKQSRTSAKAPTATYDQAWVRSALGQCDFLETSRSVEDTRSTIRFAIRWAPFGGATAGDLLVTFGVTRWRFVQMLREALRPRARDSRDVRALKRNLSDSLLWAWGVFPDSSTPPPL